MHSCQTLEKIRDDLAIIASNLDIGFDKSYLLAENADLHISVLPKSQNRYFCTVKGSGGEWGQSVEASEEPAGLLVGAVWRYIGPYLMKEGLSYCDPLQHGADEMLCLYSSLRVFTKRPELPFSYSATYDDGEQELLSVTKENSSWCIRFRTKFLYSGQNSYQTSFDFHNQALEQAHHLASNELWSWLKPEGVKRSRTPKLKI